MAVASPGGRCPKYYRAATIARGASRDRPGAVVYFLDELCASIFKLDTALHVRYIRLEFLNFVGSIFGAN